MDHLTFAQLLGNYGEFVGALAVVATLAYLALQIRRNTRSNYVSRGDTARQRLFAINENVANNKDLADLISQCRNPAMGNLTPADEERVERFAQLYLATFAGVEGAYRNGEMPQEQFDTFCIELRRIVATYPGLVPRMRKILSGFGPITETYLVYRPIFE
jgi:hypothetical protein